MTQVRSWTCNTSLNLVSDELSSETLRILNEKEMCKRLYREDLILNEFSCSVLTELDNGFYYTQNF